ncbi:MAG TPA: hypothetical protein VEX15_08285 [Nocardioidaceae bacterium]|nr:hypothetical protein [Nocardioidaceae bacterium]
MTDIEANNEVFLAADTAAHAEDWTALWQLRHALRQGPWVGGSLQLAEQYSQPELPPRTSSVTAFCYTKRADGHCL